MSGLIDLPSSDDSLRCYINMPAVKAIDLVENHPDHIVGVPMITDMGAAKKNWPGDPVKRYGEARRLLETRAPDSVVGSYLSSQQVLYSEWEKECYHYRFPRARLEADQFDGHFLPRDTYVNEETLDYSDEAILAYLIEQQVIEAKSREAPLLMSDNWRYSWPIPWPITVAYMKRLRLELNKIGIRLITNISLFRLGVIDEASINLVTGEEKLAPAGNPETEQFLTDELRRALHPIPHNPLEYEPATDGILLEIPLHPVEVQPFKDKLVLNYEGYRKLLDAGLCVVFAGKEGELHAAWAMMIRNPGDRLWVAQPKHGDAPGWTYWPREFGKPLDPPTFSEEDGKIWVERPFEKGSIAIEMKSSTVQF